MTIKYYTDVIDKAKQVKETTIEELLNSLDTQKTCYESLKDVQVRRLYFDIDVKNCKLFNDSDIAFLTRIIFENLSRVQVPYIYGGYTTCHKIRYYGYNLKYIPNAEKALSIHVVFPTIYVDKTKFDRFLDDFDFYPSYDKKFIFDQFVYGNHDKMRHPLYNKGQVQNACDRLVYVNPNEEYKCNQTQYFDRNKPACNSFIFKESFITNVPEDAELATKEQLESIIKLFYIPDIGEYRKAVCYRLLTPSVDILNPIKRVMASTKRISKVLDDANLDIIGDNDVKNKLERLKHICQQIEKLDLQ